MASTVKVTKSGLNFYYWAQTTSFKAKSIKVKTEKYCKPSIIGGR